MFNIKNSILVKILLIFTIFLLFFNVCYCFALEENVSETPTVNFYNSKINKDVTLILPPGYGTEYNHFLVLYYSYTSGSYFIEEYKIILSTYSIFFLLSSSSVCVEKPILISYEYVIRNHSEDGSLIDLSSLTLSDFNDHSNYVSDFSGFSGSFIKLENFVLSSDVIYDYDNRDTVVFDGEIVLPEPVVKNPYFITNQEELVDGNIEKLVISGGGYSDLDDTIYLQSMYYPENVSEEESYNSLFPRKEISLNGPNSPYYVGVNDSNEFIYEIPRSDLGIDLVEGNKYAFHLGIRDENNLFERLARLDFTVGVVNPGDVTNDKIDQQTDAIKENTETQKGIWDTIKEVLSYINPFSENFFVYRLLELLFDGIKALIIPSDGFFEEYFSSLNDWFSDRLGFLYYPIELLIDILGRYSSLSSSNLSFTIPDIPEPFNDEVLIESTTFNFNSILSNSTYKQVHDYYLLFVDFIIAFGLIKLAIKKWEEVTAN